MALPGILKLYYPLLAVSEDYFSDWLLWSAYLKFSLTMNVSHVWIAVVLYSQDNNKYVEGIF